MSTPILMPALSAQMEKVTLAHWVKREGDLIKRGEIIVEVETDKATMEIEATEDGVLTKIIVKDGSTEVAVNTVIGLLARPTEKLENGGSRVFASPRARRLAHEAGIDLAGQTGSGPRGRIIERDIEMARRPGAPSVLPPPPPPAPVAPVLPNVTQDTFIERPHDGMRRIIARRLSESKRTVPHFYLSVDCEVDALLAVKDQLNRTASAQADIPAYKLTVNDFLVKAWASALARVPEANVSWTEKALMQYKHADVSVAVAVAGGLITPIIRQADTKSISVVSSEIKHVIARARDRKLLPDEYEGGTTSLSNLGMYGITHFSAILNPPQATILAVGAAEKRVIVKDEQYAVATMLSCTLSVDHRAIDGVTAAELLAEFKRRIQNPMGLLV